MNGVRVARTTYGGRVAPVKRQNTQRSGKPNAPPELAGWGARLEKAYLQFQAISGKRLSLDDFGRKVADLVGRTEPYRKATVSGWFKERNEPTIRIFEAIARLAQCEPEWLMWGKGGPPPFVSVEDVPWWPEEPVVKQRPPKR